MRYINICHDKIIQYDIIMAFINYFTLNFDNNCNISDGGVSP